MILDQLDDNTVKEQAENQIPITPELLKERRFVSILVPDYVGTESMWFYTDKEGITSRVRFLNGFYRGEVWFPRFTSLKPQRSADYQDHEDVIIENLGHLKSYIKAVEEAAELRMYIKEKSRKILNITNEMALNNSLRKSLDDYLLANRYTVPDTVTAPWYNAAKISSPTIL